MDGINQGRRRTLPDSLRPERGLLRLSPTFKRICFSGPGEEPQGLFVGLRACQDSESYSFICFDLLAVAYGTVPSVLVDREVVMMTIVAELGIPKVFCKPLYRVSLWEAVLTKDYPYATDGLIFTKSIMQRTRGRDQCFKWKPQRSLTIDVLLGHCALNESNGSAEFRIYVQESSVGNGGCKGGGGGGDFSEWLAEQGAGGGGEDTRCNDGIDTNSVENGSDQRHITVQPQSPAKQQGI